MPDVRRARDTRADDKYSDEAYDAAEPKRRTRMTARARREEEPEPRRREAPSPDDIARAGLHNIAGLTGKRTLGVTSLQRSEEGWVVEVEVLEDSRIPSSSDILGLYRIRLDVDGSVVAFSRIRRYSRGKGDSEVA
ncbi:gas vesicle protein GvpO [Dactylosporangium sp. NPDC048998]|uniref:gas vesicle protein GvpO n=1 Tax=Dactylosporangium sp. NPDC048998 TaxID=3363976 RepID=UPI00371A0629